MADDIDSIMDIEKTVLEAMERHKALMGEMFYEVGRKEFKFIERSGLYFGFLFGVFQMAIWVLYPVPWILPAAGCFVVYLTNWFAV
jgi:chromate transport protein ChrA